MKGEEDALQFETERLQKVGKGRALTIYVFFVAALIVVFELSTSAFNPTLLIRNAIMVLLLAALWAGYPAARFVLAALFWLGGLMTGFLLMGRGNISVAAIAALMVSAGLILTFSTSVTEFLSPP
jgi:hypothetical protein